MPVNDPDAWYEDLMNAHRGLSDDQSARLNCVLVLLLAEQVDDRCRLTAFLSDARAAALGQPRGSS